MTALILTDNDRNQRRMLEFLQMCGFDPHTCRGPNSKVRADDFKRRYADKERVRIKAGIIDLDYLDLDEDCELHLLEIAARSGRHTLIRTVCPVRKLLIDTVRDQHPSSRISTDQERFLEHVVSHSGTRQ